MLKSLRSRLLFSYLVVIATVLVIVAAALLVISVSQGLRLLPILRRLETINLSTRREATRLLQSGAGEAVLWEFLAQTAAEQRVRILIAHSDDRRIVYDSQETGSWVDATLTQVDQVRGDLTELEPSPLLGRYRAPDGRGWIIYTQEYSQQLLLVFARPETTAWQFFSQTFLTPLLRAAAMAFFLAVLLAYTISSSVAQPLQRMAQAAEAVAQGHFEQELPLQGPDEVQRVAQSFNAMAAQVKAGRQAQQEFLANVSHDLKTPLTVIRGWSQAVVDGTAASREQQQRAAGVIHNEAHRMERLVNQLLDMAYLESGHLTLADEPIDMVQMLTEIHAAISLPAQGRGIQVTLDASEVPLITGDRDRLVQALTNLVENALAHTPPGGRVRLNARPLGDRAIEVAVQDSGKGIPPEELGRIFERFYQVDKARSRANNHDGSGLGLAIAKQVVEAHNGHIEARSRVGGGSVFLVRLPVRERNAD